MTLDIITYNMLTDVRYPANQKQDFSQGGRCQALLDILARDQLFDIINLQEVPTEGVQRLLEVQNQYHVIYRQHFNPSSLQTKKNDGLVILLRKSRFNFIPGSEQEIQSAGNPNISLVVRAIENTTQKSILVFNTHVRGGARKLGDDQATSLLNELNNTAPNQWVVGGGDFNGTSDENRVANFLQNGFALDPSAPGTITEPAKNRKIDHLFAKNLRFLQAGNRGVQDNAAQSDHYPLFARIEIPANLPPVNQPPPLNAPYQHQQPRGSFRELLMRFFSVETLKPLLDPILTRHAQTKNIFEISIKNDFRNELNQAGFSSIDVDQCMLALDQAFILAKQEKNRVIAPPLAKPAPAAPKAHAVAATPPSVASPQPLPSPAPVRPEPVRMEPFKQAPSPQAHQAQPAVAEQPQVLTPPAPVRMTLPVQSPQPSKNVQKVSKKNWTLVGVLSAPFRAIRWLFAKLWALFK